MKPMTLTEAKRRCKVGTALTMIYHAHAGEWGMFSKQPEMLAQRDQLLAGALPGVISHAQSSSIAIRRGAGEPSWLSWPKASAFRAEGPDTFSILEDGKPAMTYRIE